MKGAVLPHRPFRFLERGNLLRKVSVHSTGPADSQTLAKNFVREIAADVQLNDGLRLVNFMPSLNFGPEWAQWEFKIAELFIGLLGKPSEANQKALCIIAAIDAPDDAGNASWVSFLPPAINRVSAVSSIGQPSTDNVFGRNIDRLRKECGWSFDELAEQTDLAKTTVLNNVKGSEPTPKTKKIYADVFSRRLGQTVTVAAMETEEIQNL